MEKFIGDAVMALFGAPVAHEDDPERAVRAALTIRDRIAQDDGLQVRIAVTTGEALVSLGARPAEGEGMASGDVVNTASRLQSAAPTNGILVDETTYRATAPAIEYRDAEPVQAKGKAEPVAVWEAVADALALRRGRRAARRGRPRRPLGGARPADRRAGPGAPRARLPARDARRRPRDRQVEAGVRAVTRRGRGPRAHLLASGAVAALRRGSHLLGAERDGQGARGDPRVRFRRGRRAEAASCRRGSDLRSRRRRLGDRTPTAARSDWPRRRRSVAIGGRRFSPPGGSSSRRSPSDGRWCSFSRTSSGLTTGCSTSSITWSSGRAASRSCASAPRGPSCSSGALAGAAASATRRRSRSPRSRRSRPPG